MDKLVFDYQNYAPAVDLAFYFPENNSRYQSNRRSKAWAMLVDDTTCDELKKVLVYFAFRTNGDCKSAGVNSIYYNFVQEGMDVHFTRAVVYFLYQDPEMLTGHTSSADTVREILKCNFSTNQAT